TAQRTAAVVDDSTALAVPRAGRVDHGGHREVPAPVRVEHAPERVGRSDGLEAAAPAAAADGAIGRDAHVPKPARAAGRAAVEASLDDQSGTDARRELDVEHVLRPACGAERRFGDGAEVR